MVFEQCLLGGYAIVVVAEQTARGYRQEKDIGSLNLIEEMALNVVRMISLHWRSQAMGNPIVEVAIRLAGRVPTLVS